MQYRATTQQPLGVNPLGVNPLGVKPLGVSTRVQRPWFRYPAAPPGSSPSQTVYSKTGRRYQPFEQATIAEPSARYIASSATRRFFRSRRPYITAMPSRIQYTCQR